MSSKILKLKIIKVISLTILILILITSILILFYLAESRLFLAGKILYPVYLFAGNNFYKLLPGKLQSGKAKISETVIYCDYYAWHDGQHWQRGYSNEPLLGFYESSDGEIVQTHIKWAKDYGIDVFKLEYLPQFDESVKTVISKMQKANAIYTNEKNTSNKDAGYKKDDEQINSGSSRDVKFCLMYDSRLRFESIGFKNPPYDFNNDLIYKTFVEDMDHISKLYFSEENYFKINGKPVLWIYVARDFTGKYEKAISEAREIIKKNGFDVYLVGDIVFWNYKLNMIKPFDAASCYSAYGGRPQNTAEFAERLKFLYLVWRTSSILLSRDFIPSGIPAYDDRCLSSERTPLPVLSGTAEDFSRQLEIIHSFTDMVNISPGIIQASIATFNEHQEGSSVEPSKEWGFSKIEQIPLIFGYN